MSIAYDPEAARLEMDLDPEVWGQLLAMYTEALPSKVQALEEAWARGDRGALAALLHSLRGVSLSLAVHGVVEACAALEAALRAGTLPEGGLRRLLDEVDALEKVLRSPSSSDSSPN